MLPLILDIAAKALQIIVASFFIGSFIQARPRWRFMLIYSVLMFVVTSVSYFFGDAGFLLRGVIEMVLQFIIILLLKNIPAAYAAVYYLLSFLLMTTVELPFDLILQRMIPGLNSLSDLPLSGMVMVNVLYFPIFVACYITANVLCGRLLRMETQREFRYYVPFFLFQGVEIIFPMILLLTVTDMYLMIAVVGLVLLLVHIGMLILLIHTFRQVQKGAAAEAASKRTAEALAFQLSYYNQIREHIVSVRKIRHDMKNQLQTTLLLMESGKTDQAREHVKEAARLLDETTYQRFTGNAIADAVISAKQAECDGSGIAFSTEGNLPEDLRISGIDLCSVCSNILDNAIHACRNLPEGESRSISMQVEYRHPVLRINCRNTAVPGVRPGNPGDLGAEHGWGLDILQSIAARYRGGLELLQEDDAVYVLLWMNAEEKEREDDAGTIAAG